MPKKPRKKYQPKRRMKKQPEQKFHDPKIEDTTVEKLLEKTGNWPVQMLIDVGQKLHEGRKVMPIPEDEAPPDTPYDNRIGISYAPLDLVTNGFHIKATPRRIGTREVGGFADSSCRRCHGVGYWKVTRMTEIGRNNGVKLMNPCEYEVTCRCAEESFKKKNTHFLIDSQLGEWIALDALEITNATVEETNAGPQSTDPVVQHPEDPGRSQDPAQEPGPKQEVEPPRPE